MVNSLSTDSSVPSKPKISKIFHSDALIHTITTLASRQTDWSHAPAPAVTHNQRRIPRHTPQPAGQMRGAGDSLDGGRGVAPQTAQPYTIPVRGSGQSERLPAAARRASGETIGSGSPPAAPTLIGSIEIVHLACLWKCA